MEKCDIEVTSFLRKSTLQGHPLAKELMEIKTEIMTELKDGMNSTTFGVLGNNIFLSKTDPETDDQCWKDVKTLRDLLQDVGFPQNEINENSGEAKVDVI